MKNKTSSRSKNEKRKMDNRTDVLVVQDTETDNTSSSSDEDVALNNLVGGGDEGDEGDGDGGSRQAVTPLPIDPLSEFLLSTRKKDSSASELAAQIALQQSHSEGKHLPGADGAEEEPQVRC